MRLPELSAIRHIVLADFDRLFNFRVSDRAGDKLAAFTEDYLLTHLERTFKTLDFYKSMQNGQ
jgi:DNA repair protein RecO (recombination protein O)